MWYVRGNEQFLLYKLISKIKVNTKPFTECQTKMPFANLMSTTTKSLKFNAFELMCHNNNSHQEKKAKTYYCVKRTFFFVLYKL